MFKTIFLKLRSTDIDIFSIVAISLLTISAGFLRLQNLGYSDFIGDEASTFLYKMLTTSNATSVLDVFFTQRKGPMQLIIGHIPYLFTQTYYNEFAQRLPFALLNIASIILFYLFITRLTKNRLVGFFAAFLLSVNGFIVGFGRTAQYQSLNLVFSFGALYLYSFLLASPSSGDVARVRKSTIGTVFFCLSILSHWDAFLVLPIIVYLFGKFLLDPTHTVYYKKRLLLVNFAAGSILLLPFLIPYIANLLTNTDNASYFGSRIGLKNSFSHDGNLFQFLLYNPFLTWWFYLVTGIFSITFIKKTWPIIIWFLFVFSYYTFFVHHAGTHIYNLVIPIVVLSAITLSKVIDKFPPLFKIFPQALVACFFGFLYLQSYLLFVDSSSQYPWEREQILVWKTRKYSQQENPRHLLGFPLKRNWRKINAYISEQNLLNNEILSYISNETNDISSIYMDAPYGKDAVYYAIGVKTPYSFANDYKFPQIKDKHTVHKVQNEYGRTIVNIYLVGRK